MGFVSRGIDGAFGAEQCSCEWTLFWACPDWGNVGINGRAEDDGSPCFHHCCDTPSPTDDPDTLPWSPDDGFKPGDLGGWTDPGFGSFEPGVNGLERPHLPLSKSCSCSWTLFYACPSWPHKGLFGYAENDGSACYNTCCGDGSDGHIDMNTEHPIYGEPKVYPFAKCKDDGTQVVRGRRHRPFLRSRTPSAAWPRRWPTAKRTA